MVSQNLYPQSNPRMGNPDYTMTVLNEDFNSLSSNRWEISHNSMYDSLLIWVPDIPTVNCTNGNLYLRMSRSSGYTTVNEAGQPITADFISGQVVSKNYFNYGIFECEATFAYNRGSFPAFWLYNDTSTYESARPEIDIVECKHERLYDPPIHCAIWYYPLNGLPQQCPFESSKWFSWSGIHTYKLIWTPDKIEFFVDNVSLGWVLNTGQYWYPTLHQKIILSQQITRVLGGELLIVTPQTSSFHWVKVQEFFLAPEITVPQLVCSYSSEMATLDVDPRASNITWTLSPSNWFTTSSGNGTTANINSTYSGVGTGTATITFSFQMPSGESFTKSETFGVSAEYDFDVYCEGGDGGPVGSYPIWVSPYFTGDNIEWGVYPYAEITDMGYGYASIYFDSPGNYTISANSDHGCADNPAYAYFYVYNYLLSPNPANNDVEITIDYGESENLKMEEQEYMVTITDISGFEKSQKKYKGNKFHVATNNLKDGNYFVNLSNLSNNKIHATKQLVIKH